jgi:WhiB family redox-sensing transcriptional regulator
MTYPLPVWTATPNCLGTDTEAFFTEKVYTNLPQLRAICNSCPVKVECLDYALHVRVIGFWGGTSEIERRRLRHKLRIVPEEITEDVSA